MASEQAAGGSKAIGPAADVHALGAVLYECLTGRPPFKGATVLDTLEQVRAQEPVPPPRLQPKVPRDLDTICLKCLQKEPGRRYADAAALSEDLRAFREGRPIRARPAGPLEPAVKWARLWVEVCSVYRPGVEPQRGRPRARHRHLARTAPAAAGGRWPAAAVSKALDPAPARLARVERGLTATTGGAASSVSR
jgi:hypothetical protein